MRSFYFEKMRHESVLYGYRHCEEEINFVCGSMIDYHELMSRVDGNHDLLKQIIRIFMKTAPVLIVRIEEGIRRNDDRQVQHAAHLLKGMIGNFSARGVLQTVQKIEDKAKGGDLSQSTAILQALKGELTELDKVLEDLANDRNSVRLS